MSIDVETYDDFDDPYDDPSLDSQQQHDIVMFRRMKKGLDLEGSKQRLEVMLAAKAPKKALVHKERIMRIVNSDPITLARANNPRLTRELAEKMAREFGFD